MQIYCAAEYRIVSIYEYSTELLTVREITVYLMIVIEYCQEFN